MNTVLDDNRMLTLANAERIPMSDTTKMTFECENLNNASPATVSRAGIIYVSPEDLGTDPLLQTWLVDREKAKLNKHADEKAWLTEFNKKYFDKTKVWKEVAAKYTYMMGTPEVVRMTMLLNLFTAVLESYSLEQVLDRAAYEKIWVYAFAWALAGLFEPDDRLKFHKEILEKCGAPLPPISAQKQMQEKETVFDYFVNPETKTWEVWQPAGWTAPKRIVFSQLLIPTSDSTRAEYIMRNIAALPGER